jgi:hypothetical protein
VKRRRADEEPACSTLGSGTTLAAAASSGMGATRGVEDDVAQWDPAVGRENRESAGANCVLGMRIFLLHPQ